MRTLYNELSANIENIRFSAWVYFGDGNEETVRSNTLTIEAILEKGVTKEIELTFKVLGKISKSHTSDFLFKNCPYFYENLGQTKWLYEGRDVIRYDKQNTNEYPYTVLTATSTSKVYHTNDLITLRITKR
ncbi:hypothetical protein [Capnocytophaga sputigena]|nr:hypothetical protein [Capnocytophaga sputigena]